MKNLQSLLLGMTLLFVLFGRTEAQQDLNGWYWLNGQPHGNNVNWVKVIDANNMVAVASRGIFMKSTDAGDTWTLTQAGADDLTSLGGLNKNDLYTGWFFNSSTGLVGGSPEFSDFGSRTIVSKTTDGGVTWSQKVLNAANGGTIKGMHFINSTTGFACGSSSANLYKTTDQGETWTAINNVPDNDYKCIYAFNSSKIILGTDSRRILTTTDGGSTWTEDTVMSAQEFTEFLGITFKDANTGYLIGNPNYFAYTTNGGSSWTPSPSNATEGQRAIAYNNGAVWTAGDYQKVYKSTDNGQVWEEITFYDNSNINQPTPSIISGLSVSGNDLIVVGNYGQVTTSNDGGTTWRNKNYSVENGLDYTYASLFAESAGGNLWLGHNGGGKMLYSSNGGANWISQQTSHTTSVFDVDFINSSTGFISGGNGFIGLGELSKTTNGGTNWNSYTLPAPLSFSVLFAVDFLNENTGWIGGSQGAFFVPPLLAKTTDGGTTWTEQSLPATPFGSVSNVQMLDQNFGYVLSSTLYKTSDGGSNWIPSTNSFVNSVFWNNMFALNKDVIFLCGFGDFGQKLIAKSMDGGNSWTDITSNLLTSAGIFNTRWLSANHGVVCGTNGYVARTTNGGITWSGSNPGISTAVDAGFPDKNTIFAISDRNGAFPICRKTGSFNNISLNVYGFVEGFWNGTEQCNDTATVQLRSASSPYNVIDQAKGIISNTLGYISVDFSSAPTGNYYIVIKHRNSIETWSAAPVALTAGPGFSSYDFSSSSSQAYGNNTVLKSGKYCFYSGDVNQDGIIDGSDASLCDNDAYSFVKGYVPTDVNCDGFVDASDASIIDNNAYNIIGVQRP